MPSFVSNTKMTFGAVAAAAHDVAALRNNWFKFLFTGFLYAFFLFACF